MALVYPVLAAPGPRQRTSGGFHPILGHRQRGGKVEPGVRTQIETMVHRGWTRLVLEIKKISWG